jgi:hypothetical protein
MSKNMMLYIWMVTYLCMNVTILDGASYHLLGSWISWVLKIWFWLQTKSYISDWGFSKLQHFSKLCFPSYCHGLWHLPQQMKLSDVNIMRKKPLIRGKNHHDLGGHERCMDSITIKQAKDFCEGRGKINRFMVVPTRSNAWSGQSRESQPLWSTQRKGSHKVIALPCKTRWKRLVE